MKWKIASKPPLSGCRACGNEGIRVGIGESDEARDICDEVRFVKTVRAALVKSVDSAGSNGEPAILQSSKFWIVPSFQTRSLTYSPQQASRLRSIYFV
jgi:hypothetical protein